MRPGLQLREFCATRAGDKGDISNIALFTYSRAAYETVCSQVTAERVKAHFGSLVRGEVHRYQVPGVLALNFVLHQALRGGGARSLRTDNLGKSLGGALLRMEIDVPDEVFVAAHRRRPVVDDHIAPPYGRRHGPEQARPPLL